MKQIGETEPEPMTTLYCGELPMVPGTLYAADTRVTRLRQVVVRNVGDRDTELTLHIVRRGGKPGDDRALVLADRLSVPPAGVAELVGLTSLGYQLMTRGDSIYGDQEYPGGIHMLAWGIADD